MIHTPSRCRFIKSAAFTRALSLISLLIFGTAAAFGQSCIAASDFPTVHAEGLAEKIGDIGLTCTGGTPGSTILTYFAISLNATITNRLDANGNVIGLTTTTNTGGGAVATGIPPTLSSSTVMIVNGMKYIVPADNTQTVVFKISGIRVAVPTITGTSAPYVAGSIGGGGVGISNGGSLLLGYPQPTLLSSVINYGIPCTGSPLPTTIDFPSFIAAGATSSTVRLTEGSRVAFAPIDTTVPAGSVDTGVRFLVQISGYGANARVFVPDAIVGNDGTIATSGGAFSTPINGGSYTPGSNQLLLARVNGANAAGAGGTLAFTTPGAPTSFTSVSEIILTGGAGYAVYEVLDSNPATVEWAQVPVFLSVPANNCSTSAQATLAPELAPVSTVAAATQTDPIPRFIATTPGSDCTVIGDCTATYFPVLKISPATITLNGASLGQPQTAFITVGNGGSSQLNFSASTTYQTATNQSVANWLTINGSTGTVIGALNPLAGITSIALTLSASPTALLIPGTYLATVTINAGSAGTTSVPVTFNVGAAGPVIQSVVNAANSQTGPITAGSFAAIYGLNLVPKNPPATVTFNGFPATISYDGQPSASSPSQINVLVPAALGSATTAGVTATIDGVASNTFAVSLVANAPAVFNPGILNQDNSVNLTSAPASRGDYIQIFLTGLSTPIAGPVTVNIGTALNLPSVYAGAVASIPGLEQVNVQVPSTLTFTGGSASLSICIPGTGTAPLCSAPVSLFLH